MRRTRVLFIGEKPLALQCLLLLVSSPGVEVVGVGTRPARDRWWGDDGIVAECRRLGIPIVPRERLSDMHCDLLISVLYPFIVDETVIRTAVRGAFNLHEAPLPRWRGCNGCSHAILSGDAEYATTLHEMSAQLDSGRIVAEKRFAIRPQETARELYERTSRCSLELATEWFPRLVSGDYTLQDQSTEIGSFTNARDSLLPWKRLPPTMAVGEALRRIRALDFVPWEPAYVETPLGPFYLYIANSSGRSDDACAHAVEADPWQRLCDINWTDRSWWMIQGTWRPIMVCRVPDYEDRYPLKGRSAIGCHV